MWLVHLCCVIASFLVNMLFLNIKSGLFKIRMFFQQPLPAARGPGGQWERLPALTNLCSRPFRRLRPWLRCTTTIHPLLHRSLPSFLPFSPCISIDRLIPLLSRGIWRPEAAPPRCTSTGMEAHYSWICAHTGGRPRADSRVPLMRGRMGHNSGCGDVLSPCVSTVSGMAL
jgi:hypothetical protein